MYWYEDGQFVKDFAFVQRKKDFAIKLLLYISLLYVECEIK